MIPIKITQHARGLKMEGFVSINVSPSLNPFCFVMHSKKENICSQCYAFNMESRYPAARIGWQNNYKLLSESILPIEQCIELSEYINKKKKLTGVRLNSIGELINPTHFINLCNIVDGIQVDIPVTIWTKRPFIIEKAPRRISANVIKSNPIINTAEPPYHYDNISALHTFNIFDNREFMEATMGYVEHYQGQKVIECKGKCKECMICYPQYGEKQVSYVIFELTKRERSKEKKYEK